MKAVPSRISCVEYLADRIPDLEVAWDEKKDAYHTWVKSLRMAGEDPAVHLEDDIWLTEGFNEKIAAVIEEHPDVLIQFFSMRQKDRDIGSRWEPGGSFLMNQCVYMPAGMSAAILRWFPTWLPDNIAEHPNGTDFAIQCYLRENRMRYWLHCPSLVDHRVGKSVIDPRRGSTNRQSFTFENRWM